MIVFIILFFSSSSLVGVDIVNQTNEAVDVYVLDLNLNKIRHNKLYRGEKHWQMLYVRETPKIMNMNKYLLLALDDDFNIILYKALDINNIEHDDPVIIQKNDRQ